MRNLDALFKYIVDLLQVPYTPEGCCDVATKKAYLERFQSPGYGRYVRSLDQLPESLIDLLHACLAPSCESRPTFGECNTQ